MEELTSWIFSVRETAQVEAQTRPQVAGSPRMKLLSEQKANVQLLIAGFCHKFSSLVSECSQLPDKKNRKAACILSSVDEITIKFSIRKVVPGTVNCGKIF